MTPDEVLSELRSIRSQQDALDPASTEFGALERRRVELSEMAQTALEASHGREALIRELEHLEARLAAIEDEKIEVPGWQTAMNKRRRLTINDPGAHASQINAAIEDNNQLDRASLQARIDHLKKTLTE